MVKRNTFKTLKKVERSVLICNYIQNFQNNDAYLDKTVAHIIFNEVLVGLTVEC